VKIYREGRKGREGNKAEELAAFNHRAALQKSKSHHG
jgi:hypothetical protein